MSISQDRLEIVQSNNELNLSLQKDSVKEGVSATILVSHEAEFIRIGNDLMIKNPENSEIISDYFVNPIPIKTVEGLILSVDDIMATLNYPTKPVLLVANDTSDLMTATPPAKIGIVSATAEGPITAQDKDGAIRVLHEGDPVYLHDLIVTPAHGYVKITLMDDTLLQLGPNSRATLDKYAFDPTVDLTGEFEAFVFSGAFRYVSGKISGNNQGQHTLIKTPSANIGIRGSEIDAIVGEDGSTNVLHLSGLITVSSRYHAEEIFVYERGTAIYIPNNNASYTVNQLTEEKIQQRSQEWQIFNNSQSLEENHSEKSGEKNTLSTDSIETDSPEDAPPQANGSRHPFSLNQIDPNSDEAVDDIISENNDAQQELIEKPARLSETVNRGTPLGETTFQSHSVKEEQLYENKSHQTIENIIQIEPFNKPQVEYEEISHSFQEPVVLELPPIVDFFMSPIAIDDNSMANDSRFDMGTNNTIIINAQTILDNDVDPNGDSLTLIKVNNSVNGSVEMNENGDVVFTRGANFEGNGQFDYQISDGQGGFDTARVFITGDVIVVEENDAPIATDDSQFDMGQNNTIIINAQTLLDNDSDPNGDSLTLIEVNNSVNGTVEMDDNGDIVFTRGANFEGNGQFDYQISDGQGGFDIGRVFVTGDVSVVDDNQAPTAIDDNQFDMGQDNTIVINAQTLLDNDSDPEGDPLIVIEVNNSVNGIAEINDNGDIVFTRGDNFEGNGQFDYQISDGQGGFDTARVFVTGDVIVVEDNEAPTAVDDNQFDMGQDNSLILTVQDLLQNDSDPEGNLLTLIEINNPLNGTVEINDVGEIIFTRGPNFEDNGQFDYQISDGNGGFDTARVTIRGENRAPEAQNDGPFNMGNNESIILLASQLDNNDIDQDGDSLIIIEVSNSLNGTVEMNGNGNIIFTQGPNFEGIGGFDYQISDGKGGFDTAHVIVIGENNNQSPIARNDNETIDDQRFNMGQNNSLIINIQDLLENDIDPDGNPLTIIQVKNSINGEVILNGDESILFTRGTGFETVGQFDYQISDGKGGFDTATVIVTGENRSPQTRDDGPFDMGDNETIILFKNQLLRNDTDPDNDPLTVISVNNSINGQVQLDADGNVVFTRGANFDGLGGFDYQISDGKGGIDIGHVTINGSELIANPDNIIITNAESMSIHSQLLNNDMGFDNASLQIIEIMPDKVEGIDFNQDTGELIFTPSSDFFEPGNEGLTFSYQISNAQGHTSETTASLIPFMAHEDRLVTTDTTSVLISVAELFNNDTYPQEDIINFLYDNQVLTNTDNFIYPLSSEFAQNGVEELSYQLNFSDDNTVYTTSTTITVGLFKAEDDVVAANSPILIETLLANDKIPDWVTSNITINGQNFSLEQNVVPNTLLNGLTEFDYQITDDEGHISTAHVVIQTNDTPIPIDDKFSTYVDTPLSISIEDLFANDIDPDGDKSDLFIAGLGNTTNGSQVVPLEGNFVFTPAEGIQEDRFAYTLQDSDSQTSPNVATVTINVSGIINDDTFDIHKNNTLTFEDTELWENDEDVEGQIVTQIDNVAVDKANSESVVGSVEYANGQFTFTPIDNYTGQAEFEYSLQDALGRTTQAKVTLEVTNTPPDAQDDNISVIQNSSENPILVLDNDIDNDPGDEETLTILPIEQQPANGTIEIKDSQIFFTPNTDFVGDTRFDYTIVDSSGETDSATVIVTVDTLDPIITLPNSNIPLSYVFQNEFLLIDHEANVFDQDSRHFDGGTLEVIIRQNYSRDDKLEIQNQGPITVSSNNGGIIFYNGTPIGDFTTHFATGALLVSFNIVATQDSITALLQAISYKNTAEKESLIENRTVEFILTDGDGGISNVASRQIEVRPFEPVQREIKAEDDQIEIPFNQPSNLSVAILLDNDKPANPEDILDISQLNLTPGIEAQIVGNEIQLFVDALVNNNFDEAIFDYTVIDDEGRQDTATVRLIPENVKEGTPNDDLFVGTDGIDIFMGQEGNDTFQPSIGPDILSGGDNEDLFLFDPMTANGVNISGDTGFDTLRLNGDNNQRLDFLQNRHLPSEQQFNLEKIDKIDLSAGNNNELRLSLQDVLEITDNNSLMIDGNASNRVISTGEGWNSAGMDSSGLYNRYTSGNAELLVNADITNQFIS